MKQALIALRIGLAALSLVTIVGFLVPTKVTVGSEKVHLGPVLKVTILNAVGDLKGYSRDGLTGESWYWVKVNAYQYAEGRGVLFSAKAMEALDRMPPEVAYGIAQAEFEKVQASRRWRKPGEAAHKLVFPLKKLL